MRATIFQKLRFNESALLQGTPFFGLVLGLVHWTRHGGWMALALLGSFLLTNGVFVLNDIADLHHDGIVPHKQVRAEQLQRLGMGWLISIAAFDCVGGIVLIARLNAASALYAVGVLLAGIMYSVPPFRFKERPVASSLVHLLGGVLHFMVGYSMGGGPLLRGVMLGFFFSGVFAAGHLVQELRDYEGDVATGIMTNACRFGRRPTSFASLALFVLMPLYAALLVCMGIAPRAFMVAMLSIPVLLFASRDLFRQSFGVNSVQRFRLVYRFTYVVLGVYWMVALA